MRKILLCICICLGIILTSISCYAKEITNKVSKKSEDTVKTVHIYAFYEMQPKIYMAADILRQPKEDLKITLHGRLNFPKEYNVKYIPLPIEGETWILSGRLHKLDGVNKLKEIYKKHPNADYIIHADVSHTFTRSLPAFQAIPKERIKHVHIYEAGVGRVIARDIIWKPTYKPTKENLKACIKYTCIKNSEFMFALHLLYPTTYHVSFLDKIRQSEEMKPFLEQIKGAGLEEMNFNTLRNTLSDKEKEVLYKAFNIDFDAYKKMIANKKVNMFLVGHHSEMSGKDTALISSIKDWYEKNKDDPNQKLFIKLGRDKSILDDLKKENIAVDAFPSSAPFELMVVAGLVPDSISGTISAIYFNVPKENIGVIYRNKDNINPFFHTLKRLGFITDQQIIKTKK